MWKTREVLEADEIHVLAPYAVHSAKSLGRKKKEPPHAYRTHFQRDRARIIHSAAFRRLDGKTQVFLNGTGDHFRTRLTHTIEVASVSRTIARALALNEDLAEAVALAHDLGHSPFGHAGEAELHRLMRGHGGFDHNGQSLRTVELLEEKYPSFPGLNLSYEVLEGLRKHDREYHLPDGRVVRQPSLEGQVADLADEITYYSHDLDDGLNAGLIRPERLEAVRLWQEAFTEASETLRKPDPIRDRGFIIRCLINREVEDLIHTSSRQIEKSGVQHVDDVRARSRPLVGFSPQKKKNNAELKKFLYREFYYHPEVAGVHKSCCQLLDRAFAKLVKNPQLLGRKALRRLKSEGLERTVCDYLAGMTDRYLLRESPGSRRI